MSQFWINIWINNLLALNPGFSPYGVEMFIQVGCCLLLPASLCAFITPDSANTSFQRLRVQYRWADCASGLRRKFWAHIGRRPS